MKKIFLFMFVILGYTHNFFASENDKKSLFDIGQQAFDAGDYCTAAMHFELSLEAPLSCDYKPEDYDAITDDIDKKSILFLYEVNEKGVGTVFLPIPNQNEYMSSKNTMKATSSSQDLQ